MALEVVYEKIVGEYRGKALEFRKIKDRTPTVSMNVHTYGDNVQIKIRNNNSVTLMAVTYTKIDDELKMTVEIDRSIEDYDLGLSEIKIPYIYIGDYINWLYPEQETVNDGGYEYTLIYSEKQLEVYNRLNHESVRKSKDGFPMLYSHGPVETWSRGDFDGSTINEAITELKYRIMQLELKRPKKPEAANEANIN